MSCLKAFKKFFQRDVKILADDIEGADADIHLSGFDPAKMNACVVIKLFLGNFFFLSQRLESVCDLLE
jgi:hypothetical protein